MQATLEGPTTETPGVTRTVASVILVVWVIFLVILAIGSPIVTLGNKGESFAYSMAIFLPVAAICALAVIKSRRGP